MHYYIILGCRVSILSCHNYANAHVSLLSLLISISARLNLHYRARNKRKWQDEMDRA